MHAVFWIILNNKIEIFQILLNKAFFQLEFLAEIRKANSTIGNFGREEIRQLEILCTEVEERIQGLQHC